MVRRPGFLFVLPLLALWIVPVAIFVLLVPAAQSQEAISLQPGAVRTVSVGSRLDSATQAVDVTLTGPPPAEVKSAASGLVTSVDVKAGSPIASGTKLASVNGVAILAYAAPSPLYRDLGAGIRGADVEALSTYLRDIGLLRAGDVSSVYGPVLAKAVSALEKRIGAGVDGVFQVGFVAWVPPGTAAVGTVKVSVGDSLAAGAALVLGGGASTSVTFVRTGDTGGRPVAPKGVLRLRSGKAQVDFASLTLTADEGGSIQAFLTAAVTAGGVTAKQTTADTGTITYTGAILSAAAPSKVAVVPSSALYATAGGHTCVFTASRAGFRAVTLPHPELITGELGSVSVPSSLVGKSVVRDPTALSSKALRSCK
ncbi:peptidoglycan-binding protein [Glaciihabitans sp. UYNi722]|uniref:peptidoglycan-binding domain-containing protein n=1 Tax=Glaciihabitans sp. UYNi722 TaxID=3156344 RepID=UPI0033998D49